MVILRIKKYKKAINFWKKSIDHTNLVSDFRLRDEALISIIEAYVQIEKSKLAIDYFNSINEISYIPIYFLKQD